MHHNVKVQVKEEKQVTYPASFFKSFIQYPISKQNFENAINIQSNNRWLKLTKKELLAHLDREISATDPIISVENYLLQIWLQKIKRLGARGKSLHDYDQLFQGEILKRMYLSLFLFESVVQPYQSHLATAQCRHHDCIESQLQGLVDILMEKPLSLITRVKVGSSDSGEEIKHDSAMLHEHVEKEQHPLDQTNSLQQNLFNDEDKISDYVEQFLNIFFPKKDAASLSQSRELIFIAASDLIQRGVCSDSVHTIVNSNFSRKEQGIHYGGEVYCPFFYIVRETISDFAIAFHHQTLQEDVNQQNEQGKWQFCLSLKKLSLFSRCFNWDLKHTKEEHQYLLKPKNTTLYSDKSKDARA